MTKGWMVEICNVRNPLGEEKEQMKGKQNCVFS